MDRFHVIKHPFGGSDIYDESGKQVGYSLPSIFADGEDFYDMEGNAVGMSFDDKYGTADFLGTRDGSYGYLDQEILMGRNAWVNGNPFAREENPGLDDMDSFGGFDTGDGADAGSDW